MNQQSGLITVHDIRCYVDERGMAHLHLEDVSKRLGFTQKKGTAEYVRWERVHQYLNSYGFPTCGESGYIPESAVYLLAMKAENEVAVKFQMTLANEILPTIRRHGAYMTDAKIEEVLSDPDTIIKLATDLKAEREKRKLLEIRVEADKPKVLFADAVSASKTSILVGELAKLLKQNGIEIGQNRLFEWMRKNGFLISRKGTDYNMPTQRSMELELFEIKETSIAHSDGHTTVSKTPKVTGKGQVYFVNKFKADLSA